MEDLIHTPVKQKPPQELSKERELDGCRDAQRDGGMHTVGCRDGAGEGLYFAALQRVRPPCLTTQAPRLPRTGFQ